MVAISSFYGVPLSDKKLVQYFSKFIQKEDLEEYLFDEREIEEKFYEHFGYRVFPNNEGTYFIVVGPIKEILSYMGNHASSVNLSTIEKPTDEDKIAVSNILKKLGMEEAEIDHWIVFSQCL